MLSERSKKQPTKEEKIAGRKKLDEEAKIKQEKSDETAWPKTLKWLDDLQNRKGLTITERQILQDRLEQEKKKNHVQMMMLIDQNLEHLIRVLDLKNQINEKVQKIFFDDLARLGERQRIKIELLDKDKDGEDWYLGGRIKEKDDSFWRNVAGPAIARNIKLKTLDLHTSFLNETAFETILDGIKNHPSLEELDLAENEITDKAISVIGEGLKTNHILRRLCLGLNQITEVGAKSLAEGIKLNTSIQELYLPQNFISDAGAQAIAEAIKENSTLKKLHIYANGIKDAGAFAIAKAIKMNPIMEILYIWPGNKFSEKASQALRKCKAWDTIRGSEKYERNWSIPIFDTMKDGSKKVHVPLPKFGPTYLM